MLKPEILNQVYVDLMRDLKAMIEQTGSMASFCRKHNISRQNLVSCFTGKSEISVGLYQRICVALGLMTKAADIPAFTNITLKDYLLIDNTSIYHSMMMISNS